MGKFSSLAQSIFGKEEKATTPFSLPSPLPLPKSTGPTEEEKEAARRIRVSEKRRRGRRATLLVKDSDEESLGASARRPQARTANVLGG